MLAAVSYVQSGQVDYLDSDSGEGEGEWAHLWWGGAIEVEWKRLGHSAELK